MKSISSLRASAALITAVLLLATANAAHAQSPLAGTWGVASTGQDAARVQLSVRYHTDNDDSDWSHDVALTDLSGLTRDQLQSAGINVRFDVARDAGTLHCVGYAAHGAGGGPFTYAPSANFAAALVARGISRPTDEEQLRMTMANVTIAFVDMLRRSGDPMTQPQEIIRVLNHGVDEQYVTALSSLGYRNLGAEQLVRLRDHGVTTSYIQGLQSYGYHPTTEELVRLRDHGVTLDFVKHLRDRGYSATIDQMIRLRDAGVS
jgi:hypothetical protein